MLKVCIACGSTNVVNTGKPIYSDVNTKFSVLECADCNLKWSDPNSKKIY